MLLRRLVTAVVAVVCATTAAAQQKITSPKEAFGHAVGDDYYLYNYSQYAAYLRTLAQQSPRLKVAEIGKTAEGRPQLMAIITSPENHKNLAKYKAISARLAHAEGLTDEQARALAREGKTVVWIDGGLHATEVAGSQHLAEMAYQMTSRTDDETRRFLNDCILLLVHANPDGNELVANWYMRSAVPEQRTMAGLPRLYQKYIGHDNNREFFTSTQAETKNINRVLYHEWFPQLLYNHHQTGPLGTVVYSPPFRDPYNYNLDPLMLLGLEALGTAMHTRLAVEGKPGATMRSGGPYDGWWNGGIRNTATFHNTIAVLTEIIGSPTPMRIPLVADRQVPRGDLAMPIAPQEWHFRQTIEYTISLDRAVLDHASRLRENLLFNFYRMGKNSIERGNRDTWTANPRRDAEVAARMSGGASSGSGAAGAASTGGAEPAARGVPPARSAEQDMALWKAQHATEFRDPRGWIIPSDQADFPTATRFINALRETGISVHRATRDFEVAGKKYPVNSYVVFAAQAFRPHVMDMFEAQVHPDVFPYPGSPPTPPYDNAGWTLALQMGVQFDRVLDAFTGPFEPVTAWNVAPLPGKVLGADGAAGFVTSPRTNDSYIALNRLLKAGENVYRLPSATMINGNAYPAGALYVSAKATTRSSLDNLSSQLGLSFEGTRDKPAANAIPLRTPRVGLWDTYGGSMPAGWTRWLLEQWEFPFERVFAPTLDAGNLNDKFDVIVFVTGAIPGTSGRGARGAPAGDAAEPPDLPAEYRGQFGRITLDKTIPKLREFAESGGTIIAIGTSAANLAAAFKLPIENHLAVNGAPLAREKFYVPGSVLSAKVDNTELVGAGLAEHTNFFFDDSPVFKLGPGAQAAGVKRIAWFDSKTPLRSGWAWGQAALENGVVAAEAKVGQGKVLLFGPEILQRAQPHGTFKFLFNGIYSATSRGVTP